MAWNTREIEEITRKKLVKERQKAEGEVKYGCYTTARKHLLEHVLPQIKAVLPELTDHGPTHVENVLDNARELLGKDIEKLDGTELYCLVLPILFHDVGNVFARTEHQRNVNRVYDFVRPGIESDKREKFIVLHAAMAHCGEASDGSKNTLKDVPEMTTMDGKGVRLREISAILRFADELAEGPQRTSRFMQVCHRYPRDSQIYHQYANITSIHIDRANERIAVTYDMQFETNGDKRLTEEKEREVVQLLEYTYKRIIKLNQERQYAKHYCELLNAFKKTTVAFNFWASGQLLDLHLAQVPLTDLVVPEDEHKDFVKHDQSYEPAKIIELINAGLRGDL